MVITRDYDSYGNPTVIGGTARSPFGYSGEYTDNESGLVYLRARYYDPPTQQFLSRDTLLTQLPYAYVNGNPLNFTDPSGHNPGILILAGALACPECIVITVGVVLTLEAIVILHDAWERQQAANQACSTNFSKQPTYPVPEYPTHPANPPYQGWTWHGKEPVGGDKGAWVDPGNTESLHPDVDHGPPKGEHWDWTDPAEVPWLLFPDGRVEPK